MYTPKSFSPSASPVKGLRVGRTMTSDTATTSYPNSATLNRSSNSPYQSRVKSIGKKFNNLQSSIDANNNKNKSDELESQIRQIDEKITHNHDYSEDKLKTFTEDVSRLEESLAAEIIARELLQERSVKEMTLVESNLALELRNEKEQNKESERKVLSKIEGMIHSVKVNFAQEHDRLTQFREEQTQLVSDQVNDLQQGLKEAQIVREQVHNTIIKTMTNKINKLQETLEVERKIRNETESFLYRKIEEISNSFENQVKAEKEKRENGESQMLRLLEEACNRFEDHVASY